jgi:hypothetical protein
MRVSVVIASRWAGRPDPTLGWVLEGFEEQDLPPGDEMEILVGLDGAEADAPLPGAFPRTRVQAFPRSGAAAVRNRLIEAASGELLLFGNADARPAAGMVAAHLARQRDLPAGSLVLGSAPWERPPRPTVFDALLAETPAIFFYGGMTPGAWHDWRHAWTLNLSLRRADFLRAGGFDEQLRPVYYEDIALGWKLLGDRRGVFYEPAATVVHRHPTSFEQYLDREELLGLMAPVLARRSPEVFHQLFGSASAQELARRFESWVEVDGAMHRWIFQRTRAWATLDEGALGAGEARTRLLETIYQMHVPLKRLAFRLGFLRGMTLVEDARWQERVPAGLWRERIE